MERVAMTKKRQAEIPGTERECIQELDNAVAEYTGVMYDRLDLQKKEKEAKQALMDAMRAHKQTTYVYADGDYEFRVSYSENANISCKRTQLADEEWGPVE